jgi:cytochrome c oxidase subunit 2
MIGFTFPGLPELSSAHGGEIDALIGYVHYLMFALFVGWGAFFLYLLVRFRRKRNPRADYRGLQTHATSYVEIGVAVAEAILLIGFSIPLWSARVDALPPEDEAVVARVIAEQFAWNVHYPGPDGLFGSARVELVDTQTNPLGLDPRDPAGSDDVVVLNQLHLPAGRPAILHLSSKDVIHAVGFPEMRVKQDAVPGLTIPVWFTPTMTTAELRERTGRADANYEIVCNQLCGIGHYRMKGYLTVETEDEFAAWLESQAPSEGGGDDFWG